MIVPRIVSCCLLIFVLALFASERALSHGGVVEDGDLCVIKVSYLRAHFKIYQPATTGHKQFCEDLPSATESVFVMEYQHDSLSEMLLDFRIIRDVTGKGRFARIEDVEAITNIDAVTLYYRAPLVVPDVYTVNHVFKSEGDFIGIVSATDVETGKTYAAVFPFEVGFTGLGYWPYIIGLLAIIQIQYLFMSGRLKRWFGKESAVVVATVVFVLALPADARAEDLSITYSTPGGAIQINRLHQWILHIEDEAGDPVVAATVNVVGGMPEHNHGLPTRPRVTADLGDGNYRLEGMRFHMSGYWEIVVEVVTDDGKSTVTIAVQL